MNNVEIFLKNSTSIFNRKIQNLESQAKDMVQFLRKAYLFRIEIINTEKSRFELFGRVKKLKYFLF